MTNDAQSTGSTTDAAITVSFGSSSPSCTLTDRDEWTQLRDDHGRPIALACTRCMATLPVPEAEPGVRLVALPAGWDDEDG